MDKKCKFCGKEITEFDLQEMKKWPRPNDSIHDTCFTLAQMENSMD